MRINIDKVRSWVANDHTLDPFSVGFDREKLLQKLSQSEQCDQKAKAAIRFMLAANNIYLFYRNEIIKGLTTVGSSKQELLLNLYQRLNAEEFHSNLTFKENLKKLDTTPDVESLHYLVYYGKENEHIGIATSQDILVDATAEILRHIPATFDQQNNSISAFNIERLWTMGNIICNLRDTCFSAIMNDNCYPEWTANNEMKIVREFPIIEKIRTAAGIRNESRQMEIEAYMQPLFERDKKNRKKLVITEVKEGEIMIEMEINDNIESHLHVQAALLKYHTQLANVELSCLGELTFSQILDIISIVLELFKSFKLTQLQNLSDVSNPPAFINRDKFISLLADCTEHPIEVISKVIDGLTSNPAVPYFWESPFYRCDDKLFISVHIMTAPNVNLFIDRLVTLEEFSYDTLVKWFRDFAELEFRHSKERPYTFSVHKPELIVDGEDRFRANLCFETRDTILFSEFFTFPFPIEFDEHAYVLQTINNLGRLLKQKVKLFEKQFPEKIVGKKILIAIITDYPIYSGLVMNEIPVLDLGLLHNYYFKGNMSKATRDLQNSVKTSSEFATFRYYTDENSFNSSIGDFLKSPPPIVQFINNMTFESIVITQPFLPLKISIDNIKFIGEQNILQDKIQDLEKLMQYEYYGEPAKEQTELINEKIQYELSIVLHKLAASNYTPYDERWGLINAATASRMTGHVHLIYYLTHITSSLPGRMIREKLKFETIPLTSEASQLYERLEKHLGYNISFRDYKSPDIFSEAEEKLLISSAVAVIESYSYKPIDDNDVNFIVVNLAILSGLREKYPIKVFFHTGCTNVIDLLNQSHHYQKARDLSEELLQLSISRNEHWFGWYILFNCYAAQNNLNEAALYGCLFFASIKYTDPIEYKVLVNGAFALMKFLRNFGYSEFAVSAYNAFSKLEIDPIDHLKLSQVYFTVLSKDIKNRPEKIDELFPFIEKNFQEIIKYGTQSTIPWLAILYNLKRFQEVGLYSPNISHEEYISKLEQYSDKKIIRNTRSKIFGNNASAKSHFIQMLSSVFETRDSTDIVHELNNLTLSAHNLIRYGLKNNDPEAILLSSIVLSDQTFVFPTKSPVSERAPLIKGKDKNLMEKLKNYQNWFLSSIKIKSGQVFLWLYSFENIHGFLMIDDSKKITTPKLNNWMEDQLEEWTRNISKFYFNSSGSSFVDYDLNRQEKDYEDLLKFFSKAALPQIPHTKELLVCRSLEMTDIPHNLLVVGHDFAASSIHVCNVLSPEYFIAHCQEESLSSDYTIKAWIPTNENNFVIQMGYSILEPLLKARQTDIITSSYPDAPLNGEINIFMAHGIREVSGFKVVRTSHDPLTSILQPSRVFGNGVVAVLFICNSGSIAEDIYAMQVTSLATQLLKSDYKAVVASYWPYDVTMAARWLRVFLEVIDNGKYISEAVFNANKKLAEYDEPSSTAFLAPAGQFAMHLYGNPNIRVNPPN